MEENKIKVRQGSGYLKQLYATARSTATTNHSSFKNLTTFLVNFLPVENIDASELQVRSHFDEKEIAGLAHSIAEHGVLQPILVVQDGDRYKVIAGERRLRAAKLAKVERIPARVLSTNDRATHEIALRENLDRVDLHPLEEGEGYASLLEAGLYTSHDSIADAFHKPKSRITECIGFTKLPEFTKNELMRLGLKSRALLRELLVTDPAKHIEIINGTMGKVADAAVDESVLNPNKTKKAKDLPAPEFKFAWTLDEKSINVPGFKWKASEGKEKVRQYIGKLEELKVELAKAIES